MNVLLSFYLSSWFNLDLNNVHTLALVKISLNSLLNYRFPPAVSPLPHFPPSPPPSSSHIFATVVVLLMLKLGHESEDFPILCFADDIPLVSFDLFLYSLYL